MNLSSRQARGAMIVRVEEARIDSLVAIRFKDAMRSIVPELDHDNSADPTARIEPCPVILDLAEVTFVDSSGLGAIVAVMKFLAPGQRLELAALQPNVLRVFRLTRMDGVFVIHDKAPDGGDQHAA